MGKRVFVGWALWQKLTFCLGCAIIVVILLGCIKLGYTHWRLRRFVNVAEKERQEQATHRQMSQRRQSKPKNSDETPFGVRALESGVEVEGVWISRPNTPDSGSRQSSAGSPTSQQKRSTDVDLEKGELHEHGRTITQPAPAVTRPASTISGRPSSTISGNALSADRNRRSYASRDSSIDTTITIPPRTRCPPNSYTKWSGIHPSVYRHSSSVSTVSTLEGIEAIHKASTSLRGDDSSETSEDSLSGTDHSPISASAPGLLTGEEPTQPTRIARPRKQSVDLEMLEIHRKSMAAETGQLKSRTRRPNHSQSRDSSIASIPASIDREYFTNSRNPPDTSPSDTSSPTNPFSTPKIDALPDAVRRSSMPDVTPFAQFCQTAPPTPRPTSSSQASSQAGSPHIRASSDTQSLSTSSPISPLTLNPLTSNPPDPTPRPRVKRSLSEKRESQVILEEPATRPQAKRSASENRVSQVIPEEPATQPQAKRSSFEKRESQVMRGEGSGFEILKPGSLTTQAPNANPPIPGPPMKVSPQALRESMQRQPPAPRESMQRQRAPPPPGPPISLHNTHRPRSQSADSRKKLQKRRQPSVVSSHWSEAPGSGGNRKSVFL